MIYKSWVWAVEAATNACVRIYRLHHTPRTMPKRDGLCTGCPCCLNPKYIVYYFIRFDSQRICLKLDEVCIVKDVCKLTQNILMLSSHCLSTKSCNLRRFWPLYPHSTSFLSFRFCIWSVFRIRGEFLGEIMGHVNPWSFHKIDIWWTNFLKLV